MELHEQTRQIDTRADLTAFLGQLRADLAANEATWENAELPRFLEALEAWTADMPGYFLNRGEPVPEQPSWSLIASLLLAAKSYE